MLSLRGTFSVSRSSGSGSGLPRLSRQISAISSRSPRALSRGRLLFIVGGLLLATFMITSLSRWLWDTLPLLSFTQFPWRFLSVQAFFGALATAGLATIGTPSRGSATGRLALLSGRRVIVPLVVMALLVTALAGLQLDFLEVNDADVTDQVKGLRKRFTELQFCFRGDAYADVMERLHVFV